jgi:predicted amidohydrolase
VGDQAGDVRLAGHSRVVDPWGEVLVEAGEDEGVTFCDVDLGVVPATRAEFPVLADRRLGTAPPPLRTASQKEA